VTKRHTVAQGDTLLSIAAKHEVLDWTRIWQHADNAGLRERRPNPQVLHPGDVVVIPDDAGKEVTVPSGESRRFVLGGAKCHVSVTLADECGEPFADRKYRLKVGAQTFEGRTDPDGVVSHEVPPTSRQGELTLYGETDDDVTTWRLDLGALDPIGTLTGVKARLRNLGYRVGKLDDELDELTRDALRSFRAHSALSEGDALDDDLRDALLGRQNDF
jgi:LysM domain